jgi:hypothetical protein
LRPVGACVRRRSASRGSGLGHPTLAYEGEAGAANWGELSPAFKVCELGLEQSPIDIAKAVTADLGGLDIAYQSMKLRIVNKGHTIQVNAEPGSSCVIGGTRYELQQLHFHHPSEGRPPFRADCECRKPKPGLLLRAAAELGLDLARSTMVGDKPSDLVPARAVGAGAVLVLTGYGLGEWEYRRAAFEVEPDHVATDLMDAVDWALARRVVAA